jgi:hypothetical protein
MKKNLLLLLGLCAAVTAQAQSDNRAGTQLYVQPSLLIAAPGSDFKTATGVAIAGGVSFLGRHSVELEYVRFETEPDIGLVHYDIEFAYLLATYKYRFPITSKLSGYAGGSIGEVEQEISVRMFGDPTGSAVAGGVVGGVQYQLNEHISLDAGMKVLFQDSTRFTTTGSVLLAQAGVKFQF